MRRSSGDARLRSVPISSLVGIRSLLPTRGFSSRLNHGLSIRDGTRRVRLMARTVASCASEFGHANPSAGEIWKIMQDLETFSESGGFFFQIATDSDCRARSAEGIIEVGR
jgi:hypothetical protein